jgi:hypothetical protein
MMNKYDVVAWRIIQDADKITKVGIIEVHNVEAPAIPSAIRIAKDRFTNMYTANNTGVLWEAKKVETLEDRAAKAWSFYLQNIGDVFIIPREVFEKAYILGAKDNERKDT